MLDLLQIRKFGFVTLVVNVSDTPLSEYHSWKEIICIGIVINEDDSIRTEINVEPLT